MSKNNVMFVLAVKFSVSFYDFSWKIPFSFVFEFDILYDKFACSISKLLENYPAVIFTEIKTQKNQFQ